MSVFIGFQGFRLVSSWFHGFSLFFKLVSWFLMVFDWFTCFFKVVSWFLVGFHGFSRLFHGFSWFLVGFHGFSRWFHGFWLVSMVFSRFLGGFSLSLMVPGWFNPS